MRAKNFLKHIVITATVLFSTVNLSHGQIQGEAGRRYKVVDGILQEVRIETDSMESVFVLPDFERDSLYSISSSLQARADSLVLHADSLILADPNLGPASDSLRRAASVLVNRSDSLRLEADRTELVPVIIEVDLRGQDSIPSDSVLVQLSKRQQKRRDRLERYADSTFVRHNAIFRDSIPISRMTWISVAVPGFSQLYNSQAWKIPILYATVGTTAYFGFQANKNYRYYRARYDGLINLGVTTRDELDYYHEKHLKYNTQRQLLFGAAAAAYIYFLGDGVLNYSNQTTNVKIATTLSTILPGAGQVYNRSYWHVPFVLGGTATFAYMIDWNNRGYQRFKLAYDQRTSAEEQGLPSVDELYWVSTESLRSYKNSYRRNRDLCIILMGAIYLLNIVDAHVDAHMKDYDISDDLNIILEPTVSNVYTRSKGNNTMVGLNLKINF